MQTMAKKNLRDRAPCQSPSVQIEKQAKHPGKPRLLLKSLALGCKGFVDCPDAGNERGSLLFA